MKVHEVLKFIRHWAFMFESNLVINQVLHLLFQVLSTQVEGCSPNRGVGVGTGVGAGFGEVSQL